MVTPSPLRTSSGHSPGSSLPEPEGITGQNVYSFILYDIKNGEAFSTGAEDAELGRVPTEEDLGLKAIDD